MAFTVGQRRLLAALRILTFALCVLLLLAPVFRSSFKRQEAPVVFVLQDASESLAGALDSVDWRRRMAAFTRTLGDRYEVVPLSFGSEVVAGISSGFHQKQTDMAEVFDYIAAHYEGRHIGALVLVSDGIVNAGMGPLHAYKRLGYPFYAVAVGDTQVYTDLRIAAVQTNAYAYLNNTFPVEIDLGATKAAGRLWQLTLSDGQRLLHQQTVEVNGANDARRVSLTLEANKIGVQVYQVEVRPLDGEKNKANNRMTFSVDVLDGRRKILCLAAAPHPDITAFKKALEADQNCEFTWSQAEAFSGDVKKYDAVIFHRMPQNSAHQAQIQKVLQLGISAGFVLDAGVQWSLFNALALGFKFLPGKGAPNDALAGVQANFNAFRLDERWASTVQQLPPIEVPYGDYQVSDRWQVVLSQKLLNIVTDLPLMAVSEGRSGDQGRLALWIGEGYWRWRLHEYRNQEHQQVFDGCLAQMVQYLAQKADRRMFRVIHQAQYADWQAVEVTAELYNANFEAVNQVPVDFDLRDEQNHQYSYRLTPEGSRYRGALGHLKAGRYQYRARTVLAGKALLAQGQFLVTPDELESRNLRADFQLLSDLAHQNGGAVYRPDQLKALENALQARHDLKPLNHLDTRFISLIDHFWIGLLLIALLTTDWFLRRYWGHY